MRARQPIKREGSAARPKARTILSPRIFRAPRDESVTQGLLSRFCHQPAGVLEHRSQVFVTGVSGAVRHPPLPGLHHSAMPSWDDRHRQAVPPGRLHVSVHGTGAGLGGTVLSRPPHVRSV